MSRRLTRLFRRGRHRDAFPLVRAGPAVVLGLDDLALVLLPVYRSRGPEHVPFVLAPRTAAVGALGRRHPAGSTDSETEDPLISASGATGLERRNRPSPYGV